MPGGRTKPGIESKVKALSDRCHAGKKRGEGPAASRAGQREELRLVEAVHVLHELCWIEAFLQEGVPDELEGQSSPSASSKSCSSRARTSASKACSEPGGNGTPSRIDSRSTTSYAKRVWALGRSRTVGIPRHLAHKSVWSAALGQVWTRSISFARVG